MLFTLAILLPVAIVVFIVVYFLIKGQQYRGSLKRTSIYYLFLIFAGIPILLYGIGDIMRRVKRTHVKDEFYIEYLESSSSISLWNGTQAFVKNVTEAYWNNDSLVVSGDKGCFLIEFGKTKYNDEIVEIGCDQLKTILKNKPINEWDKNTN